jgi:hypothetical protein
MHLCTGCTGRLEQDLAEVDSTVEALWASAARLDVGAGSVGSSGHSAPMEPTNARAYDAGRTLNVVLTGWAAALGHREPHAVRASSALLARIREVRAQDWAPVLKEELAGALLDCRRAMDTAARRMFAGMCPTVEAGEECGTPVYTLEGKPEARCSTCGATWDVSEWRHRALHAAGLQSGTAAEVSRILSDPVRRLALPQGTIRQWVNRGKLAPVGVNRDGRPVYQVRKVRNLWERSLVARAEMTARRAA